MNLFGLPLPKILECRRFILSKENENGRTAQRLTKHFELDLDIQGNRYLTLDGKSYYTEPGAVVFRKPGQHCTSLGGYDMYMLTFDWTDDEVEVSDYARNSPKIYKRTTLPEGFLTLPHVFPSEHVSELLSIYKRLALIYTQPSRNELTDRLFSQLIHLVCADAASFEFQRQEEYTPTDKILSYINQHYMENITLEFLAEQVHLSRHYLAHLFKNKTGKTVFEYILSTRLEQAKRMLSCTQLSIAHIASECGFESSSYFCRRFRSAFGKTPKSFREEKNFSE